jgi:hypothetical protein
MAGYEIHAGGKFFAARQSLVSACGDAKAEARLQPGVVLTVHRVGERGSVQEAAYKSDGKIVKAVIR